MPANLYGRSVKPVSLQVDAKTLNRVLMQAGQSRLITLNVQGREPLQALAREIQREPITGSLYHVDLLAVSMTERIKLDVRIILVGESPAVQRGEGVLVHALNTVQIECLPGDLIDSIRLDISDAGQGGRALCRQRPPRVGGRSNPGRSGRDGRARDAGPRRKGRRSGRADG